MEEELAADLEAKEQNRKQILEEKKSKLQKRLDVHVCQLTFYACFFMQAHAIARELLIAWT